MVLGKDRRVMLVNRALEAMTGFLVQEASGIPCHYLLRGNLCCHGCQIKDVEETRRQFCSEANIINKNRQKIPVRLTISPIFDENGELAAFLESVEDTRSQEAPYDDSAESFLSGKLVGVSQEMRRVFKIIPVIAQTDSSVLITGQTGTGKDAVAEAIHHASGRAKGPFIKINCGALPEALLESELFGHQKGAFTGAVENKPGRFRLAHNGTVYLTEIGDLPLSLQVKLLSFLDDKVVYPLGSTKGYSVDVRVIAATHRNLERMVREGSFREDLLFRLNVIRLHLPPLVHRHEDMKMLKAHFLQTYNSRFSKNIAGFSEAAGQVLLSYPFPGNVRELRNIVEYAVNVCDGNQIRPDHLPAYIVEHVPNDHVNDLTENGSSQVQSTIRSDPGEIRWADAERKMIMDTMLKCQGRKHDAAKILGYCRSTLWRKMKKYGMID
ncbi:MAG: sigma 54-interacting transcriptional regulator [Desulfomonile tiedjei]|uniref:Sigma 54-interacting transcriptional regulator n=1 Tax=Desulfomonile tiedjei TaxID=2358 RepID=A0A9D6YZ96_9BACT|nr:sigma 54-interacting transcriptional regulator [Desulfomonile tiedjei]